jgi:organic radical activating enzyme
MATSNRDYYCNYKFKYLKIDLESKTTYNCHAATPHPIDFKWLTQNPGQIFNSNTSVFERQQMLNNHRNSSCEQNCWPAEDIGATSPRLYQKGFEKTHTQIVTLPEIIDLTIGADCNLTCTYCCKEYSTAWRRDIVINGDYNISDNDQRFTASDKDKILLKISQKELKSTDHYQVLLQEIKNISSKLKKLTVTGGEPLLDNFLIDGLLSLNLPDTVVVEIYSGLGLSHSRFEKLVDAIKVLPNLKLIISAEGIGKHLEFNRYGNQWKDFERKIKHLEKSGIKFHFQSQLSNLTIFGYPEFVKYFSNHYIDPTFVYTPSMMALNVMDPDSKERVLASIVDLPDNVQLSIKQSIQKDPTDLQRNSISKFLIQFFQRRPDLDFKIFPKTFIHWLNIPNVV